VSSNNLTDSEQPLTGRQQQQLALTEVQTNDFRARNLAALVSDKLIPGSVLDVGCGGGGMVVLLNQLGHDARGIDISEPIIDAAKDHLTREGIDSERSIARLEDLVAASEKRDNVITMDCLEHVLEDDKMMENLVEITRPGGRLVVTVPALMWLYGQRDRDIGHYRRYTKQTLLRLTEELPIEIEELRFWNVLGVLPRVINEKILGKRMDESFRYGVPTLKKRVIRTTLDIWFRMLENTIKPPLGLTLMLTATRR
jgi:SAM-dependent methyltransferase